MKALQTALHLTGSFRLDVGRQESVVAVGEAQAVGGARGQALQLVEGLSGVDLLRPLPLTAVPWGRQTQSFSDALPGFHYLYACGEAGEAIPLFLR